MAAPLGATGTASIALGQGLANSALGQKQTSALQKSMSALPPIATLIAYFGMWTSEIQNVKSTHLATRVSKTIENKWASDNKRKSCHVGRFVTDARIQPKAILVIVMLRRLIIALAAASALGISFFPTYASAQRTGAAVADGVPSWDLTASCRAAGSIGGFDQTPSERLKSCLASEQRTREQLNKDWSTFPAADRIGCVKSLTFSPTYTELLTCLEMRRDVRNSRDAKPANTKPRN
jgi:hypothetical protein